MSEMMQYVGTLAVRAKPMSRGDYNNLRDWTIPENENPDDLGYVVETVGEAPNHKDYEYGIRWIPHHTFMMNFMQVETSTNLGVAKALTEERAYISTKYERLINLLMKDRPDFISEKHWQYMLEQSDIQEKLKEILTLRMQDIGIDVEG